MQQNCFTQTGIKVVRIDVSTKAFYLCNRKAFSILSNRKEKNHICNVWNLEESISMIKSSVLLSKRYFHSTVKLKIYKKRLEREISSCIEYNKWGTWAKEILLE